MTHPLVPLSLNGDVPFDWQTEYTFCQQRWPDEERFLVVTGTFTRLLCWRQGRLQHYSTMAATAAPPDGDALDGARLIALHGYALYT